MSLHPSQLGGVDVAAATFKSTTADSSAHKKSSGTSFSAQLKDATSTAETTTTSNKAPAGETTKPVEGHMYSDILTGSRKGLFLNTTHNSRAGEAFVMVRKNGREYHIYGTGAHRVVIGLKKPTTDTSTDSSTSSSSTATTDTSSAATGTTDTGKITTDSSTL